MKKIDFEDVANIVANSGNSREIKEVMQEWEVDESLFPFLKEVWQETKKIFPTSMLEEINEDPDGEGADIFLQEQEKFDDIVKKAAITYQVEVEY